MVRLIPHVYHAICQIAHMIAKDHMRSILIAQADMSPSRTSFLVWPSIPPRTLRPAARAHTANCDYGFKLHMYIADQRTLHVHIIYAHFTF